MSVLITKLMCRKRRDIGPKKMVLISWVRLIIIKRAYTASLLCIYLECSFLDPGHESQAYVKN